MKIIFIGKLFFGGRREKRKNKVSRGPNFGHFKMSIFHFPKYFLLFKMQKIDSDLNALFCTLT